MTRMTSAAEARRASYENGLAAVVHARKRLELVTLRVDQAEKYGSARVLAPAVDDLRVAVDKLRLAQQELGDLWKVIDWEGTPPTPSGLTATSPELLRNSREE